jgi:threonine dehydratase
MSLAGLATSGQAVVVAERLSQRLGNKVWMKREDLQPVYSFKLRGAYNKIANLPDAACAKGVIAASAGNHAQGVALAAQKRGIKALIVMPRTTPSIKVESVRRLPTTRPMRKHRSWRPRRT